MFVFCVDIELIDNITYKNIRVEKTLLNIKMGKAQLKYDFVNVMPTLPFN